MKWADCAWSHDVQLRTVCGLPRRLASVAVNDREWIDRPAGEVYEYASNPANLPHWALGLGSSVEKVDERWFVETSMGRVGCAYVGRNEYGVLDHHATLPSSEIVYNPMRVIADGSNCEVLFTLRRPPATSEEDFRADAAAVAADLSRLKRVLEGG